MGRCRQVDVRTDLRMRFIWMWALFISLVLVCYPTEGRRGMNDLNVGVSRKEPRIINGTLVPVGRWKSKALLVANYPIRALRGTPTDWRQIVCGAAIIDNRLLLTAAHCFWACERDEFGKVQCDPIQKTYVDYWEVLVGEVDFNQLKNSRNYWDYSDNGIEEIFIHPSWNRKSDFYSKLPYYDIAVVKTRQSIPTRSGRTAIVKLPSNESIPDAGYSGWPPQDARCHIAGWGCTVPGGPPVERLREINQIVAKEDCGYYTDDGVDENVVLCAGDKRGQHFTCGGDFGGPLYCLYDPGTGAAPEYYHAGVLSGGPDLPGENNLSMYGRTSEHYSWIVNATRTKLNLELDGL